MDPREARLREEFIRGDIEAEEFEERLEAILRDERPAPSSLSGWYAAALKEIYVPQDRFAAQFDIKRDF